MTTRTFSRTALALVGASACIGFAAPHAHADAPVDQGWWTALNPGAPAPTTAPPDVPADGLLVQGGSDGSPVAFAALVYEPEVGAVAQRVVLKVAPDSATTRQATLQLCPLKAPVLNAEQGGPIGDAPDYDCASKTTALPGADGTTYTFDLGALAPSGAFGVAVLPIAASDRVVFVKPDSGSLVTKAPFQPGSAFPTEPVTPTATEAPATGDTSGPALPAISAGGGTQLPPLTAPVQAPTLPEPTVEPEAPTDGRVLASVVPSAATSSSRHGGLAVLLLAALGAATGLWVFAGRRPLEDDEPQPVA